MIQLLTECRHQLGCVLAQITCGLGNLAEDSGYGHQLQGMSTEKTPAQRSSQFAAEMLDQSPLLPAIVAAAFRITSITTSGFESIGTWLLSTSITVAPMRFETQRWRSG